MSQVNDTDKNMNKESISIALNLETLSLEYKNLLIKYQQAVVNYVNYLQQESTNPCDSSNNSADQSCYSIINGQAFWGTSGITQLDVGTIEECKAACAKAPGCSGATFNPDKNSCILRKGDGSPVPSSGDYAIVPKGKKLLQIVDSINNKLTEVNKEILKSIDKGEPIYNTESVERETQAQELIQNYEQLVRERIKVAKMLDHYQDVDETLNDGDLKITQNYYSFLLLLGLAIAIIFILYKLSFTSQPNIQSGGSLNNNAYYIILGIVILTIVIYYRFK
jgi:hypothetical protein